MFGDLLMQPALNHDCRDEHPFYRARVERSDEQ
jgi:hypothetical protein